MACRYADRGISLQRINAGTSEPERRYTFLNAATPSSALVGQAWIVIYYLLSMTKSSQHAAAATSVS